MATRKINEKPRITDTVVLELKTPVNSCFLADPFRIDNVKIYFVARNFSTAQTKSFDKASPDKDALAKADAAEKEACDNPGDEALEAEAVQLRDEANVTGTINTFFYDNSESIKIAGTTARPAWLGTASDEDNLLIKVEEDEDGNPLFGNFQYNWEPEFAREGDYFVCWTWTPLEAGDTLSDNFHFTLFGDTQVTTSIPTHRTVDGKYDTLMDRYIPNMYKQIICEGDLGPETLERFNGAVGDGFAFQEDQVNQLVDLIDSNAVHESMLSLLGNLFGLKLRSNDPTRWRRQIKRAVPIFKKKGTKSGLEEALTQAGITLTDCVSLWQVVSESTYCESFLVTEGQDTFALSQIPIDLSISDTDNFDLSILLEGTDEFIDLTPDYVTFSIDGEGDPIMTWVGDSLSVSPIILEAGDILKVLYKIAEPDSQSVEDYIRSLDLMDQRAATITYPPKNWNVHVIAENDAMFDVIISDRHPFADPVIFGQIRTEIPYSENIYNMEEYNGSKRDSTSPCHIEKEFVDECSYCRSSKFNIDVEIEELSDDRISEAMEIIKEYTPFHAITHRINFGGAINEFIAPAEETIEIIVRWDMTQSVFAGNGVQQIFSRAMDHPHDPTVQIFRDELATAAVVGSETVTAANNDVVLYSAGANFSIPELDVAYDVPSFPARPPQLFDNILEILSPHAHSGVYTDAIDDPGKDIVAVIGMTEPITSSEFTFKLSNVTYDNGGGASIFKDNLYRLGDSSVDFSNVKGTWDVANDPDYAGGAWEVSIPAYSGTAYTIERVGTDGRIIFDDHTPGSLPSVDTSSITYDLLDDTAAIIDSGTAGELEVELRARIEVIDAGIDEIRNYVRRGDFMANTAAPVAPLEQYEVIGFITGELKKFYVRSDATLDASLSPSI